MGPVISVRGEALLERAPDEARISVRLEALDADRRKVIDRLAERNARCLELLAGLAVETSGVSVYPEQRARGERIKRYRGTVTLTVTVTDFGDLGDLLTRLADQEQTSVDGPWWGLRRDNPAHAEARRQAVREAVARAREYASALGIRLTGLIELADEGTESDFSAPMMMRGTAGGFESEPLALEPEKQTVRAAVVARFGATEPDEL